MYIYLQTAKIITDVYSFLFLNAFTHSKYIADFDQFFYQCKYFRQGDASPDNHIIKLEAQIPEIIKTRVTH